MTIAPGTLLDQRYRVLSVLGQGGMGAVYLAEHGVLGHAVAIKVVGGEGAKSDVAVRRALQEARIAAMLRSPHVVRVSDVFQVPGQGLAIVMERLRGLDLDQTIDAEGLPAPERAIGWILEACAGLSEAHAAGLVHRDIKLSNLFLAQSPEGSTQVKLLDFGIARMSGGESAKMTQTEDVFGSPYFMAPEQVRSATLATAQSDVWSLGVCLYHLLSGRYPFEGDSPSGVLVAIATEAPTPLTAYAPHVPLGVAAVVMRCLVRDLGQRYQDVLELAEALGALDPARYSALVQRVAAASVAVESVRKGLSGGHMAVSSDVSSQVPVRSNSSPNTLDAMTVPHGLSAPSPASRTLSPGVAALAGVLVAAMLAAGVWFGLNRGGNSARAAASPPAPVPPAFVQPATQAAPAAPVPPAPTEEASPAKALPPEPVAAAPRAPAAPERTKVVAPRTPPRRGAEPAKASPTPAPDPRTRGSNDL